MLYGWRSDIVGSPKAVIIRILVTIFNFMSEKSILFPTIVIVHDF